MVNIIVSAVIVCAYVYFIPIALRLKRELDEKRRAIESIALEIENMYFYFSCFSMTFCVIFYPIGLLTGHLGIPYT